MINTDASRRAPLALVTGATGFVGRNLVKKLVLDGWDVSFICRPTSDYDIPELEGAKRLVFDGSTEALIALLKSCAPDVVFHLASLFIAQHQVKDVEPLVESNVVFGAQLLEAMRSANVTRIVNTGTSWQNFDENSRDYNPVGLYAATKQAFEAILRCYVEIAEFSVVTLKIFDTYGPQDPRAKLLSLLRKTADSGESLAMSPGQQKIDLVHIDDVANAFLAAASALMKAQPSSMNEYVISSGNPVSLKELVEIYEKILGKTIKVEWGARPYRVREVMVPWSMGICVPGWASKISLEEGLKSA